MSAEGADAALRRFERDTVTACLLMAITGLVVVTPWRGFETAVRAALGVLGGGLLVAISYRAIKGAATVVARTAEAARRPEISGSAAGEQPPQQEPDTAAADRRSQQAPDAAAVGQASQQDADAAAVDPRSQQECSPAPPILSSGRRAFLSVKFFTRYALLAVAAYVMLTCFWLHPVGVFAGVTSPFLAALMQVARMSRAPRPHS